MLLYDTLFIHDEKYGYSILSDGRFDKETTEIIFHELCNVERLIRDGESIENSVKEMVLYCEIETNYQTLVQNIKKFCV